MLRRRHRRRGLRSERSMTVKDHNSIKQHTKSSSVGDSTSETFPDSDRQLCEVGKAKPTCYNKKLQIKGETSLSYPRESGLKYVASYDFNSSLRVSYRQAKE